jgi:serine protein kinase
MTQVRSFNPALALSVAQPRKNRPQETESQTTAIDAEEMPKKQSLSASPALQLVYFGGLRQARQISSMAITPGSLAKETELLSWDQYLQKVFEQPKVIRNSHQRIYDMIMQRGRIPAQYDDGTPMQDSSHDRIYSYPFFSNPAEGMGIAGTEDALHQLVQAHKSAALGGNAKKRFILLKGPVGTAKSTIVSLMKKGLEEYSRTDEGALYALQWNHLPDKVAEELKMQKDPRTGLYTYVEPMSDDPLRVIPEMIVDEKNQKQYPRKELLADINRTFAKQNNGRLPYKLDVKGDLSPASALIRQKLLEYYTDEIKSGRLHLANEESLMDKVLSHVEAKRYILSESERKGIGTYVPKDAKNQDSTELNGDIDYSKLPMYGDPNHPLAQAYRGELNIANRGIMDFEEMLKLQREFLYDVLHASQENAVKPKNGTMLQVDMAIYGKSNMEEVDEKSKDDKMKAFWNRSIEILVRYLLEPKKEVGIYRQEFGKLAKERGIQVAPHAMEIATQWAVKTRRDPRITGNSSEADGTGLYGIGPRFLQNIFDLALVHSDTEESGVVTPFTVMRILEDQLINKGGVKDPKNLPYYLELLEKSKIDLTKQLQKDFFNAILADEELIKGYYVKYVNNLAKWASDRPEIKAKADEEFMRRVETNMPAPVNEADLIPFREDMLNRLNIGGEDAVIMVNALPDEDDNLREALAKMIFDDLKAKRDTLPLKKVINDLGQKLNYPPEAAKQAFEHLTTPRGIL